MIDISSQWLIQHIQQCLPGNSLWCCDENVLNQVPDARLWPSKPIFFSNRWDVASQARELGLQSHFNDFDLSEIEDASVDNFYYRISKEKAISHHLINEAFRVLKPNGVLYLSGQKNEGIKTYISKAAALFGDGKKIQKDSTNYSSKIQKLAVTGELLDDDNYSVLRECLTISNQNAYSKPGQFGWNKIDHGSEFLLAEISHKLTSQETSINSCLDLGCGYGFLSLATHGLSIPTRVLTDNNAAAIISATKNCSTFGLPASVIASDAGKHINDKFDLILCNPPFHQGFGVDGDLTDKFLANAKRLLADNGVAYFVVNQFVGLEKKAGAYFKFIQLVAQNKSFKVIELRINHRY